MKRHLCLGMLLALPAAAQVLVSEFIDDTPPTISSHASTLGTASGKLLASWFGGSRERARDCVIWLSRHEDGHWTEPVEVAAGNEDSRDPWACWNPVLFQKKGADELYLFYKVGPSPSTWWGRYKVSRDGGQTWTKSRRLPGRAIGPVRNKPIELPDGTILCGASTEDSGWRVHMEWCKTPEGPWTVGEPLNSSMEWGAIQPTLLIWPHRGLQILCRSKQQAVLSSWCDGDLRKWSNLRRSSLPNPNSAIDAVMLADGRGLLVYNPGTENRHQLAVATSKNGVDWEPVLMLENDSKGEYSYPAVIQDAGGTVHVSYTWRREKIKHVAIDPTRLK